MLLNIKICFSFISYYVLLDCRKEVSWIPSHQTGHCHNGGTCQLEQDIGDFECQCKPGYFGTLCQGISHFVYQTSVMMEYAFINLKIISCLDSEKFIYKGKGIKKV